VTCAPEKPPPPREAPPPSASERTTIDPQLELEALKYVDGPLYTKHRDGWLARTPSARELLRRQEQQRDWRARAMARILLTWLDHREQAEDLLDRVEHTRWEYDGSEAAGSRGPPGGYPAWSRLHPEEHGWLFPVCWEAMLKRYKEWSYEKRSIFLSMLHRDPNTELNELTVDVSFWYLQAIAETTRERTLGAHGLLEMPPALLVPHVLRLQREQRDLAALFKPDFPRLFPERPQ
jgi:hypothetical protein